MATLELGSQKVFGFVLPAGSSGELVKQSIIKVMTALFLLTVFFLFVFPRFSDLAQVASRVASLQRERENLSETLSALDDFEQNIPVRAKESVLLAIPTSFDPGYILLSLRRLASDNQVSLVSYALTGGEVGEGELRAATAQSHQVKLQIAGRPENLIAFVDRLGTSLPIASVTDLSLSEVGRAVVSGAAESRLDMALAYYHMPLSLVTADSLTGRLLTPADREVINTLATYTRLSNFAPAGVPAGVVKENIFGL